MKAGDVVQLKSGGQKMTIESVNSNGYAKCSWFVGGDFKSYTIESAALQIAEEGEKKPLSKLGRDLA